jgi:hypothetical protein
MNVSTRSKSNKDSIFEPRPYQYKIIKDRVSNDNIELLKEEKNNFLDMYVLKMIKYILIIFSFLQIFNAGLKIIKIYGGLIAYSTIQLIEIYVLLWLLFLLYMISD